MDKFLEFMQAYGDLIFPVLMIIGYFLACKFNLSSLRRFFLKYLTEHSSKLLKNKAVKLTIKSCQFIA